MDQHGTPPDSGALTLREKHEGMLDKLPPLATFVVCELLAAETAGHLVVLNDRGDLEAFAEAEYRASFFVYVACPEPHPVLSVLETPERLVSTTMMPPNLSAYHREKYSKHADRFVREMQRGQDGRRLRQFVLAPADVARHLLREMFASILERMDRGEIRADH